MNLKSHWLLRYGLAAAAALLAVLIRLALTPVIGSVNIYLTAYAAIAVVSLTLGLGPGLLTALLSITLIELTFFEYSNPSGFLTSLILRADLLLFIAVFIGFFGDRLREARARAEEQAAAAHRAEETQRESEAKYRYLVQNAKNAIIRWKSDGALTFFNEYAQSFFGYSAEEIIGRHVGILLPDSDSRGVDLRPLIHDIADHPERYVQNINENICRDGRRVWMAWTNHPVFDEQGQVAEIVAVGTDITDLKRTEDALRQSEERYRTLVDLAPDAVIVIQDGRFVFVNAAALRLHGADTPDQLIGQPVLDFVHPDDHERVRGGIASSHVGEARLNDIRTLRLDAQVVWTEGAGSPIEYDGKPAVQVMIHDMTDRKYYEEVLRETNDRLELVQWAADTGTWDWDILTGRLEWSLRLFELFGLDPKTTTACFETWESILHPEDLETARLAIDQAVKEHTQLSNEYRIVLPDGEIRWISVLGKTTYDHEDRPLRMVGICMDITARKQTEANLVQQRDELQIVLDSVPAWIFYKDRENRFLRVNQAFAKVMGLSREQLEGQSIFDLYPRNEAEAYWKDDLEVIATGKSKTDIDEPMQVGSMKRWARTTKIPYRDSQGAVIGVIGFSMDITERKHREKELENLSRFPGENPYPVLRISLDQTISYSNSAAQPLLREWQCQLGQRVPANIQEQVRDALALKAIHEAEFMAGEQVFSLVFTPISTEGYVNVYGKDITESKRIEKAIRKNEQQLRQAMRLNRSFTFEWHIATDEVTRAEECAEILGLKGDAATHDTSEGYFQKIHPEDRDQFITLLKELTPENDTYRATYRLLRPDGETIVLEEIARALFDEKGVLLSLAGMTADITLRRKAEEETRRYLAIQEGMNTLLNTALTCRHEKDLGLVCLEIAEKITQSEFGFIGEVNEKGFQDIAISNPGWDACTIANAFGHRTPSGNVEVHGIHGRVLRDGKGFFTNEPARHPDSIGLPDGHPPLLSFLGVPLIRDGRVIGMIAVGNREGGYTYHEQETLETLAPVIVEAFAHKRTEDALRQSREDLGRAQAVGQIGSWRLDVIRNVLEWSEENHRIFGIPPGTPLSYETFLGAIHPDDRPWVDAQWKAALSGESYDIEHRIVAGGETKWVREKAYLELDDAGNLLGGFGITQDITARKQVEEALWRNLDRSSLLAETMGALLLSNDPQQLVETLCTRVMKHLDCHAFFNFIVDERMGRLHLNAYAGISAEEAVKLEWLDYGVAVCGCAAVEGCRIVAEHIPTTYDPRTDLVRSFGIQAYACHPLLGPEGKVIGTLSFGTRTREIFDEDDLALMKSVADHVAVAMERINSERALRRAHDELELRVEERTRELWRSSLYARSLIEASLDPLLTISPTGKIMDVNQAMERATGVARSVLIGSDFSDFFTEPQKARDGQQRVMSEGQITDYPLTILHTAGTTIDVLCNAVVYRNEEGEIQGAFAAARDVTQRKKAEDELRNSEARLAEAQRIAHLGGWDWNVPADELIWSDEMYRIFGIVPQSCTVNYAFFLDRVHPDDREYVNDCVKQALDGTARYNLECRIVLPDKQVRVVNAQGEVLFDDECLPIRMVGTVLDVTEQVQAREEAKARQQQLIQADKMVSLGILVSGVAHEINNPNHSIMSNLSALSRVWESVQPILDKFYEEFGDFVLGGYEYSESRDKLPEMLVNALASSRRIESIVTELRDFARYSPKEKMAPLDVNAVMKSAVLLLSNLLEKSTGRVSIEYGTCVPPVLGNFQRIEQVLINLIQNACRALPSREKGIFLTTSYSPREKVVQIGVRDEGVGIPEENMKHLGDPFFTTSRALGGTGLGLWVSFNIVHEHGGTLTFSSREGEGSRAILTLPICEDHGSVRIAEETREE